MSASRRPLRRVLLKLSGEALCAPGGFGIDSDELSLLTREICDAAETDVEMAVVVGGGNLIRGAKLARDGLIDKATADYMGMLGTVMNGLALKEALDKAGRPARCMTAVDIPAVAEPFIRGRALRHMEKGRIVILAGGTGNPFFTTDTCAALRATELDCQAVLKATKVDGVYSADPVADASATRFEELTFTEALDRQLGVMDLTALAMCQEQRLPLVVFDFKQSGAIRRVIEGENIGTLVYAADKAA